MLDCDENAPKVGEQPPFRGIIQIMSESWQSSFFHHAFHYLQIVIVVHIRCHQKRESKKNDKRPE